MSKITEDSYKTPLAELTTAGVDDGILKFKRFTAWGVFGLTIITLGIYPIYWLYSRATVVNTIHEKQISSALLITMVVVTVLSIVSSGFGDSEVAIMASEAIGIVNLVVYLMVLFKVRNRLKDIMNRSSESIYKLSPVLTFLFFSIYLQYKINQCVDESSKDT